MKYLILSFFFKIYHLVLYKKWLDGLVYRSKILGLYKNNINVYKVFNTKVVYNGNHNNVYLHGSIEGCNIRIEGDNNVLLIEEKTTLHNCTIIIRGNNCNVKIGKSTRIQSNGKIVCQGDSVGIRIGELCLFSENIDIWNSDTHTIYDIHNVVINKPQSVNIGNHVWLGKGVSILKGVSIADNVVIGMDSVVTTSFHKNCVIAGNPAKVLKEGTNWDEKFVF